MDWGFPCGANAGHERDTAWSLGWRGPPSVGSGNPLQYPCLGNSMHREASRATVLGHDSAHHEPRDPTWFVLVILCGSFYHFDPTPSALVKLASLLFFKLDHTLPPWGLLSATPSSYRDLCAKVSSLTLAPSQTATPWDFSGGPMVKTSPSNACLCIRKFNQVSGIFLFLSYKYKILSTNLRVECHK